MTGEIIMQKAYDSEGNEYPEGATVTSRGEQWRLDRISREAGGNSSGRVLVSRPCPDALNGWCPHFWHHNGRQIGEYFPHVFGLTLRDESVHPVNRGSW